MNPVACWQKAPECHVMYTALHNTGSGYNGGKGVRKTVIILISQTSNKLHIYASIFKNVAKRNVQRSVQVVGPSLSFGHFFFLLFFSVISCLPSLK